MESKLNLWVFWYNSMTMESSSFPMSYHKTKKGALAAMKAHKQEAIAEWEKQQEFEKKWCEKNGLKFKRGKFGRFQSWQVEKFELNILD